MADELVIKAKIPAGADEVLIRIPYDAHTDLRSGRDVIEPFEPADVSVDYRQDGGVWTPADLTGTDAIVRYLQ